MAVEAPVERVAARAFRIPTDALEADGTISWDATTLVLTEMSGGGQTGLGYTYASTTARKAVTEVLGEIGAPVGYGMVEFRLGEFTALGEHAGDAHDSQPIVPDQSFRLCRCALNNIARSGV
jgi:hypothetical protein